MILRTLLAAALLVLAGCSASPSSSPATSRSSSGPPSAAAGAGGIGFEMIEDATPAPRDEASVEAAFDAASAADLLDSVPALDFDSQAVLCLYLGERTGTWGFSVSGLTIEDGELHIASAERRPRGGDTAATHPAQCLAVDRGALPAGDLAVTADDTVSDEFIVGGTIKVPAVGSAP
jgi:hypothetical protein